MRVTRVLPVLVLLVLDPIPISAQDLLRWSDIAGIEAPAPDHRIAYGDDPLQFGHLRLPNGSGPHPVIVFLHGGCWLSAFDIAHVGPLEEALRGKGYAVWSLEYRRAGDPGGGWPGTFLDVAAGVDHLRELAREHPLDLSRVIASGHSAGGQLAVWTAARPRIPESSPLHVADPLAVAGVLALAPAPALAALEAADVCGDAVGRVMGGSAAEYPERYGAVSPMRLLPAEVPQRLVVGELDSTWAPPGRAYYWQARTAGLSPVALREVPGAGHFELVAPWTAAWEVVMEELEALVEEVGDSPGG